MSLKSSRPSESAGGLADEHGKNIRGGCQDNGYRQREYSSDGYAECGSDLQVPSVIRPS